MEKAVDYMAHEFASVRTGKASSALVDNIEVQAYGTPMRLKQLAVITTPEARLIVVQPFDMTTMKDIDRGIRESKLGINPVIDGKLIRLRIPELSEERRRDLCKTVRTMYGGVGYGKQKEDLKAGVDTIVATPGRLLDHLEQGSVDLSEIEILVLDEVDRMRSNSYLPVSAL